jgi:hypothetical protein
MARPLPPGYSVRTVDALYGSPRLAPFYKNRQLIAALAPDIYGYRTVVRWARRVARAHYRNRVDPEG